MSQKNQYIIGKINKEKNNILLLLRINKYEDLEKKE